MGHELLAHYFAVPSFPLCPLWTVSEVWKLAKAIHGGGE